MTERCVAIPVKALYGCSVCEKQFDYMHWNGKQMFCHEHMPIPEPSEGAGVTIGLKDAPTVIAEDAIHVHTPAEFREAIKQRDRQIVVENTWRNWFLIRLLRMAGWSQQVLDGRPITRRK